MLGESSSEAQHIVDVILGGFLVVGMCLEHQQALRLLDLLLYAEKLQGFVLAFLEIGLGEFGLELQG